MTGVLGSIGNDNEPYALVIGVIAIVSSVFFLLQRYGMIIVTLPIDITDEQYLMFFAIFALLSGIIHLFTTIGLIGTGN
ncbi:hypothetical protein K9M79_05280 [Candidatus Woesearchaeota archaeon]|nr:hypothetical protein [Candidatus Woesearchaeota archaeon]